MSESDTPNFPRRLPRLRAFGLALAMFGILAIFAQVVKAAMEKKPASNQVEAVGDQLEYKRDEKKLIAKGNVVVTYGDVKLTSDYAEVDREAKKAHARGHVVILRGDHLAAKGEEVFYDFGLDKGEFPDGRIMEWPFFIRGKNVQQNEKGKYEIEDGEITTCDLERPHYQIRAKRVKVHTGDKIVARNITLHVLKKKVFWWPYAVIPLQNMEESPIQIIPGFSSEYGGYILTSKSFSIVKPVWGKWHADWRARRGFGGGLDFDYHFERVRSQGMIKTYLTQDKNAPSPSLSNPYSSRQDRARGRVLWKQRTDFNPDTNLTLRFQKMADEFFLQDFFQKEFRADVEPTSFVNLTHNSDRYGSYVFNQVRINKFENVVERLPEIRFDWKNAPFFSDRLYYESATSLSNLNEKFSRSDRDLNVFRSDSVHEWTLPLKWNEIKLTPSANIRETLYSREKNESDGRARTSFGAAVDLRSQFYKVYNVSGDFLGMEFNQIRHVFEPVARYEGTLESTVADEDLVHFDSVDTVDDINKITFGAENRIQTKRMVDGKMKRVDFVSLNTFLSYEFHPDVEFSKGGFTAWTGEMQVRPYEWLQFEVRYDFDMHESKFRELTEDFLARKGRFHVLFGHRLVGRRDYIGAPGNNQFVFDTGVWLNKLWATGFHIRWNAENNKLEEWQISATRDLHDFLLDLGFNVRNSDIRHVNKELFFLFRLKAFPQYPLKSGNRASFSEPRIGATVAGSDTIRAPGYTSPEG